MIKKILKLFLCAQNDRDVIKYRENIFNTKFEKNALLVYILHPFEETEKHNSEIVNSYGHTNGKEAQYITHALYESGYNIDVVQYDFNLFQNFIKYDLILGFGEAFEMTFYKETKKNLVRVFYGTGQHPRVSDVETIKATYSVYLEKGVWLGGLSRVVNFSWPFQLNFSDVIVALGSNYVLESYKKTILSNQIMFKTRFENINCFYHKGLEKSNSELENKKYKVNYLTFCWFGSSGSIHKGLFQTIRVLKQLKDAGFNVKLIVCGVDETELRTVKYFFQEYNWIQFKAKIDLSNYKDVLCLNEVSFNIFPSVTEGGAPSILNIGAICGIPTICGLSVGLEAEVIGILLESNNDIDLYETLLKAISISENEYVKITRRIFHNIVSNYNEEKYLKNWKRIISNINQ